MAKPVEEPPSCTGAGLACEIEREQHFTLRGWDLFRNRLESKERARPPARAPAVPDRPGEFAEGDGAFCPRTWPGGMGTASKPRYTILGLIRFMWQYKVRSFLGERRAQPRS